jgi:nitrite reductase/ring-hydroxylating ferredoxin subunit
VIFLCRADEVAATGAKSVVLGEGADRLDVVVVLKDGKHYGYINSCPHQFIPLEIFPDQFFSDDGKHLICCGHGALFEPDTGLCIEGPCENEYLDSLAITEKDGLIYLSEACTPDVIAREKRAKRNW